MESCVSGGVQAIHRGVAYHLHGQANPPVLYLNSSCPDTSLCQLNRTKIEAMMYIWVDYVDTRSK